MTHIMRIDEHSSMEDNIIVSPNSVNLPSFGDDYSVFGWILPSNETNSYHLEGSKFGEYVKKTFGDRLDYWIASDAAEWGYMGTLKSFLEDLTLFSEKIGGELKISIKNSDFYGISFHIVDKNKELGVYGFFYIILKEEDVTKSLRMALGNKYANVVEIK